MSDQIKNGGPAFPATETHEYFGDHAHTGMSMRDWFAGQALAWVASIPIAAVEEAADVAGATEAKVVAAMAYDIADAMLAAREGKA